ncbi:MAG: YybS family protein [Desulfobulbaceae bacterium]|jgi:uncharacterized protein YybS (DUF2232 family)|nr:YybS family protein [Desulfobulbaceae bacterium]
MNSLAVGRMDNGKLPLIFRDIVVLSLLFALPLTGLLLTPAALYLHSRHGLFTGKRMLLCAACLAVPLTLWLSSLSTLVLSVAFLAAGLVLAASASRGDGPLLSLAKAALTLAALSAALLLAESLLTGQNIYQALVVFLQSALREAAQYAAGGGVSAETQAMVTETLNQAARLVPLVLPAIMLIPALLVPFATILLCNAIENLCGLERRWIDFRLWRLPDFLVWLVIALVAVCRLLDGLPALVAINALILASLAYAMQGLAAVKFFFDSRRMPMAAQFILIFLVVSQSFGLMALAILGLIEVWADFRRLGRRKPQTKP